MAIILDDVLERSIPDFRHFVRMIAIERPTFEILMDQFKSLDESILTTAPMSSWPFIAGTPEPRYLLFIAERIHKLQYSCSVTLLKHVHEMTYPICESTKEKPRRETELEDKDQGRHSGPGITFKPIAWWSPSNVERYRVEGALWRLMIY